MIKIDISFAIFGALEKVLDGYDPKTLEDPRTIIHYKTKD